MRKLLKGFGLAGALIAMEGSIRLANVVAAFRGGDAVFYFGIAAISIFAAGVLLISFAKQLPSVLKWFLFVLLLLCAFVLFNAPGFGAVLQAMIGIIIAIIGVLALEGKNKTNTNNQPYSANNNKTEGSAADV